MRLCEGRDLNGKKCHQLFGHTGPHSTAFPSNTYRATPEMLEKEVRAATLLVEAAQEELLRASRYLERMTISLELSRQER